MTLNFSNMSVSCRLWRIYAVEFQRWLNCLRYKALVWWQLLDFLPKLAISDALNLLAKSKNWLAFPLLKTVPVSTKDRLRSAGEEDRDEDRDLEQSCFGQQYLLLAKNREFQLLHRYYTTQQNNPLQKIQSIIAICCKLLRVFYALAIKDLCIQSWKDACRYPKKPAVKSGITPLQEASPCCVAGRLVKLPLNMIP